MPASRQARATVTSPRLTRSRTPLRRCARLSAGATTFFLLSTLTSMESGCAWPLFLAEGLECLPSTWALRSRGKRLNPLLTSQRIEDDYRRYLLSGYAPRSERFRRAFGDALTHNFRLTRGPYLQAAPPFEPGASVRDL